MAAEIGSANLTDTISNAWNFEIAGDYIIVFQQKAAATKNIYLNSLTLTEQTQVSADIAIAQASDKYFLNLHDAFAYQVASNAETVKLTCDIWEQDLVFPAGAALDLNGYTLTANSILTYDSNALIDSSAEKSGMLKIKDADGNMLNEKNSQLPLYDSAAEGYRFFSLSIETVTITGKENPTYWFKITSQDFPNIYSLECSDLLIKVKLKWNGGEGTASANTAFTRKWLEAYNAKPDIYINVSAVNGDNLDNFTLIPCITANGVTLEGAEMK